jgi:CheY-like chemotaxis protein
MDGLVATQSILKLERVQRRRHTPIVAVTAGAMLREKQLCFEAGVDDVLTKPYSIEELERTVTRCAMRVSWSAAEQQGPTATSG